MNMRRCMQVPREDAFAIADPSIFRPGCEREMQNHPPVSRSKLKLSRPREGATTDEPSVQRDFCVPDHRAPFFYFELEQCGKFFRRRAGNHHADLFEFCLDDAISECRYGVDVNFIDNRGRRFGWNE